jgi:hypothetical protein
MAKKPKSFQFDIKVDAQALHYFQQELPELLVEAREKAVMAAGMVWSDETKSLTREENHIDTSLYINSIGYITDVPETNKSGKGKRTATEADVMRQMTSDDDTTTLLIGSNVGYAAALEKRYGLMARGLDRAQGRMKIVAETQVRKTLFE